MNYMEDMRKYGQDNKRDDRQEDYESNLRMLVPLIILIKHSRIVS